MQEVYNQLQRANMLVLASPIYYHGISGQLKCAVDRFYSVLYPKAPETLQKVAMFLSSGDSDMYDGARFSYEGDFLGCLGLEDTERKRDAVVEQIDQIMIWRRKIERFIESVKDLPDLITGFDESLWAGLVDSMTVYAKDRIVFRLTCGMEIEA